jgi:hypothetical protein
MRVDRLTLNALWWSSLKQSWLFNFPHTKTTVRSGALLSPDPLSHVHIQSRRRLCPPRGAPQILAPLAGPPQELLLRVLPSPGDRGAPHVRTRDAMEHTRLPVGPMPAHAPVAGHAGQGCGAGLHGVMVELCCSSRGRRSTCLWRGTPDAAAAARGLDLACR